MDAETAGTINEHLALAFDHLREAIMLTVAGKPVETNEFITNLDALSLRPQPGELPEDTAARVVAAASEMGGLFDEDEFSKKVAPSREYEDDPLTPTELVQAAADLGAIIAKDPETGLETAFAPEDEEEEEDDEFSGLFDDIDEDDDEESGPDDAPAAF